MKISQATLKTSYSSAHFNVLMAPIGSGKTYYFGGKFIDDIELPEEKCLVFLAPLKSIVAQAYATQRMENLDNEKEDLLKGFTIFNDDYTVTPGDLGHKKIAMTAQKFTYLIHSHPEVAQRVGAIVLDEFDAVLSNYAPQDRARNSKIGLHMLFPALHNLCKLGIYVVLTSATMSEYAVKALEKYPKNTISFCESLSTLQPKFIKSFNSLVQIEKSALKTAVYATRVSTLAKLKDSLVEQGYKVALLRSKTMANQAYEMEEYDNLTLNHIMLWGKVPDDLDFLLFNAAYERGISIVSEQFDRVYVWNSNAIVQLQASGRFRYNAIEWWFKDMDMEKLNIAQPGVGSMENMESMSSKDQNVESTRTDFDLLDKWLGIELGVKEKNAIADELNWKSSSRTKLKWNGVKKRLQENGYSVIDKRIENKRYNIIQKK